MTKVVNRIEKHVDLILDYLEELRSEKSYRGIERLLQLILQSFLDLCLMFISALNLRSPRTYSDIGNVLKESGIINDEKRQLVKSIAGMRNVLVQGYFKVRKELVMKAAREEIPT